MNINIGLVGYGYWGKNLLRNMIESEAIQRMYVCDLQSDRLSQLKKMYPDVQTTTSYSDLINNEEIDAIIIATPTSTHFEIAKASLLKNKHILVEKPVTSSTKELKELIQLANDNERVFMVDHTFLYNGAVLKIKEYIESKQLGKLKYIDATRINLGIYQNDVNVIWDLATHDLSIVKFLIDEKPYQIRAIGQLNPSHSIEDLAYLFIYYASGLLVQINCSWASPVKIRQMIIAGSEQMIIYDDIEPSHKIKLYNYQAFPVNDEIRQKILIDYRLGDITIPKFSTKEPLKSVLEDFLHCIINNSKPRSNGEDALEIVNLLELAELSLSNNGKLISVE